MTEQRRILVTGSSGQLGSEIAELAPQYRSCSFVLLSRSDLVLDNESDVEKTVAQYQPHFIINCAAYTAVDKAESEKEEALAINAKAVGLLAGAAKRHHAKFIHLSTDYVFDGRSPAPLTEDHPAAPVNFYGETKWRGEQEALAENADSLIIRTAWVYSAYGKNFVKTMLRLMAERESINVVADQWGSPTYAADLAKAILHIIGHHPWQPGIYHYSNEGRINWAQFAQEIGRLAGSHCIVQPITTDQYPTPARRPSYSILDKTKIANTFGIKPRPWQESLQECIGKLQALAS